MKLYDNEGRFIGYGQGLDDGLQNPPRPSPKEARSPEQSTPGTTERQQEREAELALKYAVEMRKLELDRENSEKNRGLAFFALIIIAAFIAGYLLFR